MRMCVFLVTRSYSVEQVVSGLIVFLLPQPSSARIMGTTIPHDVCPCWLLFWIVHSILSYVFEVESSNMTGISVQDGSRFGRLEGNGLSEHR